MQRRLFALDHNFPQPMLAAMVDALPQVELVPVRDIDPTFSDLADWELLRELHRDERPTAQTYLDKIALRTKTTAARLFSENKLSPGDLQRR